MLSGKNEQSVILSFRENQSKIFILLQKVRKEKTATKTPIHFIPWGNPVLKILIKSERYPTG